MAGSHRAERPPKRPAKRSETSADQGTPPSLRPSVRPSLRPSLRPSPGSRRLVQRVSRRAVVVAAVLAVVPALWLGIGKVVGGGSEDPSARHTELPIPPVTTPGTPTPSTTVSSTPSSSPTSPASSPAAPSTVVRTPAGLPRVAPDAPRRLLSPGLLDVGFDNSVTPRNGSFRAASTAEVARWGARGEPGNPATDTVYVIGKTFTRGVSAFDTLPQIAKGARVVIRTDNGDLTYRVDSAVTRAAAGLADDAAFRAKAPGRLVLVGLRYDRAGNLTGQAVVVFATLSDAIRT